MKRFPPGFVWGAATSAYQIEGAPAADGKGESIWDRFCARPGAVERNENATIACDHYRRHPEDVAIMKQLGLAAYRFSVSWPRIQPTGQGAANAAGLAFYDRLVDALLEAGISPWVALYHWDLPQALEDRGGWPARETASRFADLAAIVARALGDRVGTFLTVNEPWVIANCGYRWGQHAPGIRDERLAFGAAYNLLLAHGLGYDAVKAHAPQADVGLPHFAYQPYLLNRHRTEADFEFIDYARLENHAVFLDPVLKGSYPSAVLERLGANAPSVQPDDLRVMQRCDFVGVQYYKDQLLNMKPAGEPPRYDFLDYTETGWPVTPLGLHDYLVRLQAEYGAPRIVVTENGSAWPDVLDPDGRVHDLRRQEYLSDHLTQVHRAIAAGVNVTGYFVWSLLDNFEWVWGYRPRFGLVYTEYASQARYIKDSGHYYARVIRENGLE
jgi:beta-glucosidase